MQAKTRAIIQAPPMDNNTNTQPNPALNVWQSLYYELSSAGYSKAQIAHWSHVSPRTVDRLLLGQTKQPSFKALSCLLHAYCRHAVTNPVVSDDGVCHA